MGTKAPDTRNRIDNQRNITQRKPKAKKRSLSELRKEVKEEVKDDSPLKLKAEKKPSKGQIFKKQHGHSKTVKRNMHKKGLNHTSVVDQKEYKVMRKTRKLAERKVRQKKHSESVTYKRLHGKQRGKSQQGKSKNKKGTEKPAK